jgi:8-oxo-dGTP pyrophosphatase MutT (NUDIX family)
MELIATITDKVVFGEDPEIIAPRFYRTAARAVLEKEDKIALLYVSKRNYYKLPGGGIEEGEDPRLALEREIQEEVGCDCEVIGEVGITKDIRLRDGLDQTSYCFLAKVQGEINEQQLTEEEKENGFELRWVALDEAIKLQEESETEDYAGKFIVVRDHAFLRRAKEMLKKNRSEARGEANGN